MREIREEAKFQRQSFLVLRDVSVHPGGIGFEVGALGHAHVGHVSLRDLSQAKDAMLAIKLDVLRPQNGGQIAGSVAPGHVHLPQPVLRGDVALGKKQVWQVSGGDVGNAERVVGHSDGPSQAGKVDRAIHLRQRRPNRAIKPEVEGEEDDQQEYQHSHDRAKNEFGAGWPCPSSDSRSSHGKADYISFRWSASREENLRQSE